jgi:hypothetical protein
VGDAGVGGESTADGADEKLLIVEERVLGDDEDAVARDVDSLS